MHENEIGWQMRLSSLRANAAKEFHKRVPRFFGVLVVYEKLYGVHNGQDEGAQ